MNRKVLTLATAVAAAVVGTSVAAPAKFDLVRAIMSLESEDAATHGIIQATVVLRDAGMVGVDPEKMLPLLPSAWVSPNRQMASVWRTRMFLEGDRSTGFTLTVKDLPATACEAVSRMMANAPSMTFDVAIVTAGAPTCGPQASDMRFRLRAE